MLDRWRRVPARTFPLTACFFCCTDAGQNLNRRPVTFVLLDHPPFLTDSIDEWVARPPPQMLLHEVMRYGFRDDS